VDVFLPKFKFDTSYNMNQTLAKMGMPTAFGGANADFPECMNRTKTTENLYIGLVIHKAYIDVYEEGTEAPRATGVAMKATAVMEPLPAKIFNADRPFIFAIVHNQTGAILFMGKVNDPTNKLPRGRASRYSDAYAKRSSDRKALIPRHSIPGESRGILAGK